MRFSVLSLALLPMAPAPAAAPVTLSPFHDTYVNSAAPDSSYGNVLYLSAENSAGLIERSYMEFNTSSLAGQTIASAILKVWVVRENSGGGASDTFEVYPIYTAWADSLSYNESLSLTKGALAASVASTDYGVDNTTSPPRAVDFDVTSLVQSWASGGINKGLMIQLASTASADIRFASLDEPNTAIRPTLTVTASTTPAPAPDPAPTPDPTPAAAVSGRDNDNGDKCGCGVVTARDRFTPLWLLGIGLLALVRRR